MSDKFIHSFDDIREEQDALLERQQDPDFALASDYAVGALAEEKAREVRARIERDPEFRDLVEPLLLLAERGPSFTPRPRHEIEKRWAELRDRIRRTTADPAVLASLAVAREARSRRRVLVWSMAAVLAAVVILPAVTPVTRFVRDLDRVVAPGSTEIVDLGGGSKAVLSSGSKLVRTTGSGGPHFWFFTGEAEFHIVPGGSTPFIVHMGGAEVVVTGTKFRVHGYRNEPAHVTVIEGTVQVWGIDDDGVRIGQPVVLNAGESARAYRTRLPEKLP